MTRPIVAFPWGEHGPRTLVWPYYMTGEDETDADCLEGVTNDRGERLDQLTVARNLQRFAAHQGIAAAVIEFTASGATRLVWDGASLRDEAA